MNIFNNKNLILALLISAFFSNLVFANNPNSLVTTIPDSGKIEGFVIASCGMCNFDYKRSKGCSLTIKIEDTIYPVKGTNSEKYGCDHSGEGLCSTIRIAYVSGEVKNNKIYSNSFTLIERPISN